MKIRLLKVPARFFDDHASRDLPTPKEVRHNDRFVLVRADDPAIPELLADAEFYCSPDGPDAPRGVRLSARATVRALKFTP